MTVWVSSFCPSCAVNSNGRRRKSTFTMSFVSIRVSDLKTEVVRPRASGEDDGVGFEFLSVVCSQFEWPSTEIHFHNVLRLDSRFRSEDRGSSPARQWRG